MKFKNLVGQKLKIFPTATIGLLAFYSLSTESKIAFIEEDSAPVYILPRSQIRTYLQKSTVTDNLKPVKAVKPGALSDDELAAIPERYLPPDLKEKQRAIKARLAEKKKQKAVVAKGATPGATPKKDRIKGLGLDAEISSTVRIRNKKNKVVDIKIDQAIWVPPTAATEDNILAPQVRLPEVALLEEISVTTSGEVKKEINPGDRREMFELFGQAAQKDPNRSPLLKAFGFYKNFDYATSATLALDVMSEKSSSPDLKTNARFLLAHSLFQAGFYATSLAVLNELVSTKWRRSAIGMSAIALEKTKDDSAANQVLARVSISQIPETYQPLFSFHLGRILLNTGAREPAMAAFAQVPVDHERYPEAQYYLGILKAADLSGSADATDWDNEKSDAFKARSYFENALLGARTGGATDLMNLVRISMARLAYQVQQYNQAIYFYSEVDIDSSFAREAAYESAWALYRLSEYNRSLGILHPLGSPYFESKDLAELWILRSLNYLKLCRFDEAKLASGQFEFLLKSLVPELKVATTELSKLKFEKATEIESLPITTWIKNVLLGDAVVKKDLAFHKLLESEKSRLAILAENKRIADVELRTSSVTALQKLLDRKISGVAKALKPYLVSRTQDIQSEYAAQKDRLDFLRFEIYSQATKFPKALERPEAQKLIAQKEFLPGVFAKGHEILWRFSGEYWKDELRSYDYFLPTECKTDSI